MARRREPGTLSATECARLTSAGTSADVRRWQRYLSGATPCPVEELAKLAVALDAGPLQVSSWVHELARRRAPAEATAEPDLAGSDRREPDQRALLEAGRGLAILVEEARSTLGDGAVDLALIRWMVAVSDARRS